MQRNTIDSFVEETMLDFARLTGLEPADAHPRRYLWTDAFAVCNYLELFRRTNDAKYRDLALRLVDQVHHTLGRHRQDDPRTGWISGLDEREGELHPTAGGLRIGKRLNERRPDEPLDEHLEWEQDGQYYHYLTKWMHALNRVSRVTGDPTYTGWAMELARAAHAKFTYLPPSGGRKRMYWKMSIDLSYTLVPSMGQHDALDGFVTYSELQAAAWDFGPSSRLDLGAEIDDMATICWGGSWATDDPLGIGGLLSDASRIAQLMRTGVFRNASLLETVVDSALIGLQSFVEGDTLGFPAQYRLAFRELGLSIGLKGVQELRGWIEDSDPFGSRTSLVRRVDALTVFVPLGGTIERFWMDGRNRETGTWTEHREINMVMLATSLAPEGFLMI
jgi:hypothetical protein